MLNQWKSMTISVLSSLQTESGTGERRSIEPVPVSKMILSPVPARLGNNTQPA